MKKLLSLLLLLISCSSPKYIGNRTQSIELQINQVQFDSICKTDTLSSWITILIKDYETKLVINKSMCIKDSIIYTVLKTDSCYYFEKRINK